MLPSLNGPLFAARSPVFARMLATECRETTEGTVKIEDVSKKVFRIFLDFLYTAELPGISFISTEKYMDASTAVEVLVVADKYEVLTLKDFCLDKMRENIDSSFGDRVAIEILRSRGTQLYSKDLVSAAFECVKK